jgi:hypothetical protein
MKKNYLINLRDDEVNLIELIKFFWVSKDKIILATLISFLIGIGYYYLTPKTFDISLNLKPSSNSEFLKLYPVYEYIDLKLDLGEREQTVKIENLNMFIAREFIDQISDNKNIVKTLKNIDTFKKDKIELVEKDSEAQVYNYAKLFKINKVGDSNDYVIKFYWHDKDLGEKILIEVLNELSLNFKDSYFKDLTDILKLKKDILVIKDLQKLEFLEEQYEIASKLGFESDSLSDLPMPPSYSLRNNDMIDSSTPLPYYLLGKQALIEEMNVIKERKYERILNLEKIIIDLKSNYDFNWISYNEFLINSKITKPNIIIVSLISIILGLVIGLLSVIISSNRKVKKVNKN